MALRASASTRASGSPRSAAGARDLEDEEVARDAPALGALLERCGCDVVGHGHVAHSHAGGFELLGGHREVQDVAGVVAVEKHHARPAVRGAGGVENVLGRRRGEDVADRRGVGEAPPDISREGGLVARTAADDDADLAVARSVHGDDRAAGVPLDAQEVAMRGGHPADHLVDDGLGRVDEFLGLGHGTPLRDGQAASRRR